MTKTSLPKKNRSLRSARKQFAVILLAVVWLISHHYIVTTKRLDFINNYVDRHYRNAFEKKRKKENELALSGKEEKWRM